jgi:hypothetical protein
MMYSLKHNSVTVMYYSAEMKAVAGPPHVMCSHNIPCDTQVRVTLVARALLTPVAKQLCRYIHGLFTAELVFILEFTSHQNCLLLFMKHSAVCILTRK